jgi:hypothetical protein
VTDFNAQANAAIGRANHGVTAVVCKKCQARCAWATSKRTQRRYLCNTTAGTAGTVIPLPHRPHFKTCGQEN